MSDQRVYRAFRGAVWHWPAESPGRTPERSACTSTPINPTRPADPVSVDLRDRCAGHGCRKRWDAWLEATTRAALADCVQRWHAELHPPGLDGDQPGRWAS